MLRQALTNLLQNAADAVAMREDGGRDGAGHITVTVHDVPDGASICWRMTVVGAASRKTVHV